VGLALNPAAVEGQIEGSVVQGLGWALTEGLTTDGQAPAEREPARLPHADALDVPRIDCVIVETPVPNVPFGVPPNTQDETSRSVGTRRACPVSKSMPWSERREAERGAKGSICSCNRASVRDGCTGLMGRRLSA